MPRNTRTYLFVAFFALIAGANADQQRYTIAGTVSDIFSQGPVVGASLTLVGTGLTTTTDAAGSFCFDELTSGRHEVSIRAEGYNDVETEWYTWNIPEVTIQFISLMPTELSPDGEVLDRGRRVEQIYFPDELPPCWLQCSCEFTSVDELLGQVAGVQTNTQGEVFIRGTRACEVCYVVDGVPIDECTDQTEPDTNLIEESADSSAAKLDSLALPTAVELAQNYPNPFNPTTTIEFSLPEQTEVRLDVLNVLGQVVTTLVNDNLPPGLHAIEWDGRSDGGGKVASGVYFYRLATNDQQRTKKMMLVK